MTRETEGRSVAPSCTADSRGGVVMIAFALGMALCAALPTGPGSRSGVFRATATTTLRGTTLEEARKVAVRNAHRAAFEQAMLAGAARSRHPGAEYWARVMVGLYAEETLEVRVVEENPAGDELLVIVEIRVDESRIDALLKREPRTAPPMPWGRPVWIEYAVGGGPVQANYRQLVQDSNLHRDYFLLK